MRGRGAALAAGVGLLSVLSACGGEPESGVEDDLKDAPASEGSTAASPGGDAVGAAPAALWVTASGSGEVYRVDVATREVSRTIEVGHNLYDVEFADGAIWVAGAADALHRIDPDVGETQELVEGGVREVAVVGDGLWLALAEPEGVAPFDAAAGTAGKALPVEGANSMLAVDGVVWAWADRGSEVSRVDTATGKVTTQVVASGLATVVADDDALWVTNDDELSRVDPTTLEAEGVAELPARPTAALASPDSDVVWLAYEGGSMASYDASTEKLSQPVEVATADITAMVFLDGTIWAAAEDGSLVELDARTLGKEDSVELLGAKDQLRIAVER